MNVSVYIKDSLLTQAKIRAQEEHLSLSKLIEQALKKIVREPVPHLSKNNFLKLEGVVKLGGNAVEDTEKYYE